MGSYRGLFTERPALKPQLEDGSRVGVIGGGPAGSLFAYFLLRIASRLDLQLQVDVYEPKDFNAAAPKGCNMCGGIISERLVQLLAAEGINLPQSVVQRGIDSYSMHMDVGSVLIATPLQEKRIAAVHRGGGPRGVQQPRFRSFDGYLLELAKGLGAAHIAQRVEGLCRAGSRPVIKTQAGSFEPYDLIVMATGINAGNPHLLDGMKVPYKPPAATKTYICEFWLGRETIKRFLGSSMHVFLLNIPRLEFAALIPKGDYATLCLLGENIDRALVRSLVDSPELRRCMPPGWEPPDDFCHCSPKISVSAAVQPFADRIVFVGDCGVTRLYKDGIGAAYVTAKAAARAAALHGIAEEDFRRWYWPACRQIARDNMIGKVIFAVTRQIQKRETLRRAVWRMVADEQRQPGPGRMSAVLWDTFTGSARYRDILLRTLHPAFLARLIRETAASIRWRPAAREESCLPVH